MLPYSPRSFLGYRLIQEYFHFPEKFLFFDVAEPRAAPRERGSNATSICCFFLDQAPRLDQSDRGAELPPGLRAGVNLFQQVGRADPPRSRARRVPGDPGRAPAAHDRGLLRSTR